MMNLTFKRKISRSMENRASVITIPRAIARSWEQYKSVDLIFDGNCLVIKPIDNGSDNTLCE